MSERQPHEVALVRAGPGAAPEETAVIRLVGLLPADWTCTQQVRAGRIRMLVRTAGAPGEDAADAVRTWLAGALADNSLRGWRAEGP
ncbi:MULTISPECIES: hypothetical protein [unclassified Streptomyces]|uniref:hypothetical protein n=1 Tax=unclassified Streptomyces TaxID=2593676 RepID=UPI002DD8A4A1|nr:hypothetical protein [Streptomyces sp. NBC_01294]WRZ58109.1 hypothetical protein OG534_17360 [Streptomyces sp. NBC_01294]